MDIKEQKLLIEKLIHDGYDLSQVEKIIGGLIDSQNGDVDSSEEVYKYLLYNEKVYA